MTPEQHVQRIRQIAFKLEKADCGMGMPRDVQTVLELRIALNDAIKDYATAMIAEGCCTYHRSGGDTNLSCGGDIAKAEGTQDEDREALDEVARYEEREAEGTS